ncbi:hypothetical protein K466DRAFT_445668, partial [Polyporus arcularius HHB13444]
LHPKLKTQYFIKQGWLPHWIKTAITLLQHEWAWYKPTAPAASLQGPSTGSQSDNFGTLLDNDPLEEYLNTPVLPSVDDPVAYWHSLDDERNAFARMALDILSAPGMFS